MEKIIFHVKSDRNQAQNPLMDWPWDMDHGLDMVRYGYM